MRRLQLIELHEQPWLPSSLRDEITDALGFGLHFFKAYAPIVPMLQNVLDSTKNRSIIDMCSGGGGPWLDLSRELCGDADGLHISLTDKYPNLTAFEKLGAASGDRITFYPDPVDATEVPRELNGFRTMFTSFHHFRPDEARAVLQNAVDAGQGIAIFEVTKRAPARIALMVAWALAPILLTPLIRPFRWSRLLWTYLIPIIPFVMLWDGVVSCFRTHRPEELRQIIGKLTGAQYQWELGECSAASGKVPIAYLIGYPREATAPA
jgi:hypothetical protein